jgi:hypothetical protein
MIVGFSQTVNAIFKQVKHVVLVPNKQARSDNLPDVKREVKCSTLLPVFRKLLVWRERYAPT